MHAIGFLDAPPSNLIVLRINDVVMSEVRDHDPHRALSGLRAAQVHTGPPMKAQFKNLRTRECKPCWNEGSASTIPALGKHLLHEKPMHPRLKSLLLTFAVFAFTGSSRAATNTLRVYFIGNSVADTVRYGELVQLAATRGVKLDWGRTMIPGAPLEWIYTNPNDGFQRAPYGLRWQHAENAGGVSTR